MLYTICVKDNKAWNKFSNANFFFAILVGLKMLFSQFSKFEFLSLKWFFQKPNNQRFSSDFQRSHKMLVFEEGLLCENFWKYNGSSLNIFYILDGRSFSLLIITCSAFNGDRDLKMGHSIFRSILNKIFFALC